MLHLVGKKRARKACGGGMPTVGTRFAELGWFIAWRFMVAPSSPAEQAHPKAVFDGLPEHTCAFYLKAMDVLDSAGVPYLVGGAYALAFYAGIVRHTKDFDTFLRPRDIDRALKAFEDAGYRTAKTHPHWVAKAFDQSDDDPDFVDMIYGSGNGMCVVDDAWFDHAVKGELLDRTVRLCPPEEIIWSKSFVMERERFDGADIAHLILARGHKLDWHRLTTRYKGHERVLLTHVLLFGYAYPSERSRVPDSVMEELFERVRNEPSTTDRLCRGTLMSWSQYLPDTRDHGFTDARLKPHGKLTQEQVDRWTKAEK
jgi:hypothetical protein